LSDRQEGLTDASRPGAPRKITDVRVEVVVTRVLTERGPGRATHWPTRLTAGETGLSQSSVSRIWRAFGRKPHLVETRKLNTDPAFIDKVRDVVGLYMNPPEHALVLAVDEKSQIHPRPHRAPPADPPHYPRAHDPRLRRHRHQKFLRFLKVMDANVPQDLDLHVMLD
jgi:hypothetical protein